MVALSQRLNGVQTWPMVTVASFDYTQQYVCIEKDTHQS